MNTRLGSRSGEPLELFLDSDRLFIKRGSSLAAAAKEPSEAMDRIYLESPYTDDGLLALFPSSEDWMPFSCTRHVDYLAVGFIGLDGRMPIEWRLTPTGGFLDQVMCEPSAVLDWAGCCECDLLGYCRHTSLGLIRNYSDGEELWNSIMGTLGAVDAITAAQKFSSLRLLNQGQTADSMLRVWLTWVSHNPGSLRRLSSEEAQLEYGPQLNNVATIVSSGLEDTDESCTPFLTCDPAYARLHGDLRARFIASLSEGLKSVQTGIVQQLSPLTGEQIGTGRSEVIVGPSFPFISHCFLDGTRSFFDFRGGGWISDTKALLIPKIGAIIEFERGDNWGRAGDPEVLARFARQWISALSHPESVTLISGRETTPVRVLVPEIENLGHMLWNVASGLATLSRYWSETSKTKAWSPFKVEAWRTTPYQDYVKPFMTQVLLAQLAPFESLDDRRSEPATNLAGYDGLTVMLLSGVVHHDVIRGLSEGWLFSDVSRSPNIVDAEFQIYVNLRGHNKRCRNLPGLLAKILGQLARASKDPIIVEIEVLADTIEEAEVLQRALDRESIDSRIHVNLELKQLVDLIKKCNIAIAPIGSGLVVPTWIIPTPTLAHGNLGHLGQLEWWPTISTEVRSEWLCGIEALDVVQHENALYCDYEVRDVAFTSAMFRVLMQTEMYISFRQGNSDPNLDLR